MLALAPLDLSLQSRDVLGGDSLVVLLPGLSTEPV